MTRDPPARLLLARHGQSTWNAAGRWQGRADPPLSELGERQAAAVLPALQASDGSGLPVSRVWTSPLRRARQTAEIIGTGLGVEVEMDPRLQERDAGEWTGLTRAEIEDAWPGYLAEHRRPPGFEPDDHLIARALEVLDDIARSCGAETVLVVTHGGLIRVIERHHDAEAPPVPNLGGRVLVHGDDGLEPGERFLLLDPASVEITTPRQI